MLFLKNEQRLLIKALAAFYSICIWKKYIKVINIRLTCLLLCSVTTTDNVFIRTTLLQLPPSLIIISSLHPVSLHLLSCVSFRTLLLTVLTNEHEAVSRRKSLHTNPIMWKSLYTHTHLYNSPYRCRCILPPCAHTLLRSGKDSSSTY